MHDPFAEAKQTRTANVLNKSTGRSSLTISAKLDGVGAACQPSIIRGEQSGLPTRIAATESASLCEPMKS
jgi:hypothetical protein